jgi:hypothetical protein
MPGILFYARDPGPANHVLALIEEFSGSGAEAHDSAEPAILQELRAHCGRTLVVAQGSAVDVFSRAGVEFEPIERMVQACETRAERVRRCRTFLEQERVSAVVTGTTDIDDDTDRVLWIAARQCKVMSCAVLDRAVNLAVRFREPDGTSLQPDHLLAASEDFRHALESEGLASQRLRVIGSYHTRSLLRRARPALARRDALRREWGAADGDKVVLFASECFAEMALAGRPTGISEHAVLSALAGQLAEGRVQGVGVTSGSRIVLVVRLHPRDTASKYDALIRELPLRRVLVSQLGTPEEAILAADLVAGISSSLLLDATVLGRPTLRSLEG